MPIISSVTKLALFSAGAIGYAHAFAGSETPAPEFVKLDNGREIRQQRNKLIEIDVLSNKASAIRLPLTLRRAIADASSIAFPADRSRLIDAKEYVLLVVNSSSSSNPMGFCGAGEEGTLYVLQIHGTQAVLRFSVPVQSCLKSISLATENNNKSPYLAITWTDAPASGIQIRWQHYGDAGPMTRQYQEVAGRFVQIGQ